MTKNPGEFTPQEPADRDNQLGDALAALSYPEHREDFWAETESKMATEQTASPEPLSSQLQVANTQTTNTSKTPRRVLLVAASMIPILGVVALLQLRSPQSPLSTGPNSTTKPAELADATPEDSLGTPETTTIEPAGKPVLTEFDLVEGKLAGSAKLIVGRASEFGSCADAEHQLASITPVQTSSVPIRIIDVDGQPVEEELLASSFLKPSIYDNQVLLIPRNCEQRFRVHIGRLHTDGTITDLLELPPETDEAAEIVFGADGHLYFVPSNDEFFDVLRLDPVVGGVVSGQTFEANPELSHLELVLQDGSILWRSGTTLYLNDQPLGNEAELALGPDLTPDGLRTRASPDGKSFAVYGPAGVAVYAGVERVGAIRISKELLDVNWSQEGDLLTVWRDGTQGSASMWNLGTENIETFTPIAEDLDVPEATDGAPPALGYVVDEANGIFVFDHPDDGVASEVRVVAS